MKNSKRARRVAIAGLAVSALATVAVPVSAQAAPAAPAAAETQRTAVAPASLGSIFHLNIRPADPKLGPGRSAELACVPPAGGPPLAGDSRACEQLKAANGHIERIPTQQGACVLLYSPVTVSAHGFWLGQPRSYQRTFVNQCLAVRATGGVIFNF